MPGRRGPGPGPKPGPGGARGRRRRHGRRRRRRRRIVVGGAVVLAGGAVAHKVSKKDADRIEAETGQSVEDMSDQELDQAMQDLNIQSMPLDDADQAAIDAAGDLDD